MYVFNFIQTYSSFLTHLNVPLSRLYPTLHDTTQRPVWGLRIGLSAGHDWTPIAAAATVLSGAAFAAANNSLPTFPSIKTQLPVLGLNILPAGHLTGTAGLAMGNTKAIPVLGW